MNAHSALKHLLTCVLRPALAACQSLPDLAMRTDTAQQLAKVKGWHATPQWHLVGQQDEVVPAQIARAFAQRAPARQQSIMVIPGADHTCCWAEHWPALWRSLPFSTLHSPP